MNAIRIHKITRVGPLALAIGALPFSVPVCHLGIALFILGWMAEGHWEEKKKAILSNPIALLFVLLFLLHLIGVAYSDDKKTAWFVIEKKIALLILPLLLASIKLEKKDTILLLHVFVLSCVTATFVCLGMASQKALGTNPSFNFDAFSAASFYEHNPNAPNLWMFFSYIELTSGIGMHPSYFALYLSFCLLLLYHLHVDSFVNYSRAKRIVLILISLYLGLFILFLSSRAITIAFLLVSLFGVYHLLNHFTPFIRWAGVVIYISLFLGFLYLNPVSRFRNYQEMESTWPYLKPGLQTQSTTIRASLWSLSVKSLTKINLLWGAGIGDIEHIIQETGERFGISNVMETNDPHSQYLQTLLGLGLIGLITLISCIALPAILSYQQGNYLYLGFIFVFSFFCLTETVLELQKGIVFFSLFNFLILFQHSPVQFPSIKRLLV